MNKDKGPFPVSPDGLSAIELRVAFDVEGEHRLDRCIIKNDLVSVEKALEMYRSVQLMAPATRLLDIHTITAAMIHHVPYSEVTKEQRQQAKGMNYFWLYQPGTFYEPPERDKLFAIYTPAEIKQMQVDLKWDGSEDLYESIQRFFQPVK